MGKRGADYIHYPAWSEARFWTFVRSALRAAWNRYPVKFEVLKEAYVCTKENIKTGKQAKHYRCNECNELFPAKEVIVDHIEETGALKCYADLPRFVERLFCGKEALQVLCKEDHNAKTYKERYGKEKKVDE